MFIVTTSSSPDRTSSWADATPFTPSMASSTCPHAGAMQFGLREDDHPIERVVGLLSRLSGPAALLLAIGAGIALLL